MYIHTLPMAICPLRKVPVVRITAFPSITTPDSIQICYYKSYTCTCPKRSIKSL